jgi:hypothetical protein
MRVESRKCIKNARRRGGGFVCKTTHMRLTLAVLIFIFNSTKRRHFFVFSLVELGADVDRPHAARVGGHVLQPVGVGHRHDDAHEGAAAGRVPRVDGDRREGLAAALDVGAQLAVDIGELLAQRHAALLQLPLDVGGDELAALRRLLRLQRQRRQDQRLGIVQIARDGLLERRGRRRRRCRLLCVRGVALVQPHLWIRRFVQ